MEISLTSEHGEFFVLPEPKKNNHFMQNSLFTESKNHNHFKGFCS